MIPLGWLFMRLTGVVNAVRAETLVSRPAAPIETVLAVPQVEYIRVVLEVKKQSCDALWVGHVSAEGDASARILYATEMLFNRSWRNAETIAPNAQVVCYRAYGFGPDRTHNPLQVGVGLLKRFRLARLFVVGRSPATTNSSHQPHSVDQQKQ